MKPDYLSIMIGINDTWRRYDSNDITSKEQFETNLTELLEKIKKEEILIMIIAKDVAFVQKYAHLVQLK